MEETIAAVSTGQAPGGIGIVRLSGEKAIELAGRVFRANNGRPLNEMKGYTAALGGVYTKDSEKLDDVIALVFRAPKSYTGEDVVELSCHGGLYITRRILRELLLNGARLASAGEFTRRAFLNGKMDLTQAEAVMGIISSSGRESARSAQAAANGTLYKLAEKIAGGLKRLCSHLAAWADFPEEDVPEIDEAEALIYLKEAEEALAKLLESFDSDKIYRHGVETVIAGSPNVGKSTLMNLLSGKEKSIVTEYAGTTRDIVENEVTLAGVPLLLADTAGIRESGDPVEQIGVKAARERLKGAELTLAVFDGSKPLTEGELALMKELDPERTVAIINKSDLKQELNAASLQAVFPHIVKMSAKNGDGARELEDAVKELLNVKELRPSEGVLFTERQRSETANALSSVREGIGAINAGFTLDAVTVCAESALSSLYSLTGQNVSDEIIDSVFETFCVGK